MWRPMTSELLSIHLLTQSLERVGQGKARRFLRLRLLPANGRSTPRYAPQNALPEAPSGAGHFSRLLQRIEAGSFARRDP